MSRPDGRNPEHRSSSALLLFCIGIGLCALAYFLGIGAVISAALSGGDPTLIVGGVIAAVGLAIAAVLGLLMMLIGGVWMIAQVIADQSSDPEEKRYRDVER
jgi:hypothetical protein